MNKEQPEAIRLAELIDYHAPIDFDGHLAQAAAELRRLSADGEAKDRRIAHLEATASANYGRGHADAHLMLSERIAELERFADLVLEETAVECDKRAHAGDAGAWMAARAIRALKGEKK